MAEKHTAPRSAEDLRATILARYDSFSGRLKQVARHVLDHPDDLALETLTVIAENASVQPSAIVRFAKALGFSGASPMQRVLRDGLLAKHAVLGYGERVRRWFQDKKAGWYAVLADPQMPVTSPLLDQVHHRLPVGDPRGRLRVRVRLLARDEVQVVLQRGVESRAVLLGRFGGVARGTAQRDGRRGDAGDPQQRGQSDGRLLAVPATAQPGHGPLLSDRHLTPGHGPVTTAVQREP